MTNETKRRAYNPPILHYLTGTTQGGGNPNAYENSPAGGQSHVVAPTMGGAAPLPSYYTRNPSDVINTASYMFVGGVGVSAPPS